MIQVTPHLNFRGTARSAMEFYQSVFGGETAVFTFRDAHNVQSEGGLATAQEADQIMWSQVSNEKGFCVMLYDVPSALSYDPGDRPVYVSVRSDTADELEMLWNGPQQLTLRYKWCLGRKMAAQRAVSGSVTTSRTALLHADTLAAYLKDRLPHRRTDALKRLAEVLLGILQAESALHRKIALHLPRTASLDSKTRVVARVFHDLHLTPQDVLDVLLPLLPNGRLVG